MITYVNIVVLLGYKKLSFYLIKYPCRVRKYTGIKLISKDI